MFFGKKNFFLKFFLTKIFFLPLAPKSHCPITGPIAPKICTKNDSYVPQLRSKFQVSTFIAVSKLERFQTLIPNS